MNLFPVVKKNDKGNIIALIFLTECYKLWVGREAKDTKGTILFKPISQKITWQRHGKKEKKRQKTNTIAHIPTHKIKDWAARPYQKPRLILKATERWAYLASHIFQKLIQYSSRQMKTSAGHLLKATLCP